MNKNETEVRVSDLLAMLLKGARVILCVTLALGLLGAAYGAYSVIRTQPQVAQGRVEAAEKDVEIAQGNVTGIQNAITYRREVLIPRAEQKVARSERLALQMQEYMENSIYYGMNPFHRGAARLRFAVEADAAADLVGTYAQMCPFDVKTMEEIQKILGIEAEPQYLEELISVSGVEGHFVEICFCYDDLELAEKAVRHLYEAMAAQGAERLQPHTTRVLSVFTGYEVDWAMSESHIANEESLTKAEQELQDAIVSLMDLHNDILGQTDLANTANSLYDAEKALENTRLNANAVKRAKKYGVIGAVLGFILGCGWALARGLFSGVIQNQSEVASRYAFPLIGILPRSRKYWFDGAIRKLEGDPEGSSEAVTQATVQSLVSRAGDRKVCLVSANSDAVPRKLVSLTGERFQVIDNIIDSAEAVKELAAFDGIVLVEERGKSRMDLVDAEVLRAKALNKEIIGIVLA